MEIVELTKAKSLKGEITPPPDKSISHRAIMFASIADGKSIVKNFLRAEDPISTMNAFRMMGIEIEEKAGNELVIHGKGLYGLREPFDVIDCGNSGTTARLISGILSGNPFFSVLTGDDSLKQRPMARVINPLKEMGADISARSSDKYLPMAIKGKGLKAINYNMPVASAQVKSCLILAGLYADGTTIIIEPQKSRDHTERMLRAMGAEIEVEGLTIKVKGEGSRVKGLQPIDITIPSDFSSAAFFIAGALIVPDSEILIRNVCINPTRTGLLDVIKNMGGDVRIENMRDISGEPVAGMYCKSAGSLKAVKIGADIMPSLIDEFPILCVLATQADGVTEIRGAEELRVKESDRIKAMATELKKLGVELEEYPDGIAIKGKASLKGNVVESYHDHRIAMSLAIAALVAEGTTTINNPSCVDISFPGFFEELKRIMR
ncbi:3-phosphoshikimate 1-carboxyvinyltransferase [Dissulfurispira sp.]|uniref:3-phosphoshikimate 1-carboxyvinyltransferase n=1 Tax=Dissulfurispira sp. TaxID=2817609 RepID=UPI002FDA11B1